MTNNIFEESDRVRLLLVLHEFQLVDAEINMLLSLGASNFVQTSFVATVTAPLIALEAIAKLQFIKQVRRVE